MDFVPSSLQKQTVLEAINDAGEDFGFIVDEFRKAEVPLAIVFLAVTESKFNPKYMNKRIYAGPWQLSMFEAKTYGLDVNRKRRIDERRDVQKSTRAFLKVLKNNYKEFGTWPLAMIAYNAGDGRLRGAIRKAGTDNLEALLYGKKKFLPRTTANYIKRIIIYASTANYPPVYDRINSMVRASEMDLNTNDDTNETNKTK
jgi:membrane-bound lytic murein transglycosylase D